MLTYIPGSHVDISPYARQARTHHFEDLLCGALFVFIILEQTCWVSRSLFPVSFLGGSRGVKKKNLLKNSKMLVRLGGLSSFAGGNAKRRSHFGRQLGGFLPNRTYSYRAIRNCAPWSSPAMKTRVCTKTRLWVFIAAVFIIDHP